MEQEKDYSSAYSDLFLGTPHRALHISFWVHNRCGGSGMMLCGALGSLRPTEWCDIGDNQHGDGS